MAMFNTNVECAALTLPSLFQCAVQWLNVRLRPWAPPNVECCAMTPSPTNPVTHQTKACDWARSAYNAESTPDSRKLVVITLLKSGKKEEARKFVNELPDGESDITALRAIVAQTQ
jgi:hypothetical protein